jgi:iron complex transport system substrate-binding protein
VRRRAHPMRRAQRRSTVALAIVTVALAACSDGAAAADGDVTASTAAPAASTEPWTFTDDRGETTTLTEPPTRIVSYVGTAAVLWDFGVRPVGVFGPQHRADGSPEPAAGRVDLDAVGSAGEGWEGVNVEALAALDPDLVVTGGSTDEDLWVIGAEQLDEVERIAPVVAIRAYEGSASQILAGYERFVAALGIDLASPELRAARERFEVVRDEMRSVADAKRGLRVLVTFADADALYIAKPQDFPDLLELQRLGVELVEPGGPDDYWQALSWEQAGRYPADLILHDERSYGLQPSELAGYPTWSALPAVEANQVAPWNAETILSYQGLTLAFERTLDAIRGADTTVVG